MHYDICHSFSFAARFDLCIFDMYEITDVYFGREFRL